MRDMVQNVIKSDDPIATITENITDSEQKQILS